METELPITHQIEDGLSELCDGISMAIHGIAKIVQEIIPVVAEIAVKAVMHENITAWAKENRPNWYKILRHTKRTRIRKKYQKRIVHDYRIDLLRRCCR